MLVIPVTAVIAPLELTVKASAVPTAKVVETSKAPVTLVASCNSIVPPVLFKTMLPEVLVWRVRAADVDAIVSAPDAVISVPNPVILLPFMARAVLEKLYSSVPAI